MLWVRGWVLHPLSHTLAHLCNSREDLLALKLYCYGKRF